MKYRLVLKKPCPGLNSILGGGDFQQTPTSWIRVLRKHIEYEAARAQISDIMCSLPELVHSVINNKWTARRLEPEVVQRNLVIRDLIIIPAWNMARRNCQLRFDRWAISEVDDVWRRSCDVIDSLFQRDDKICETTKYAIQLRSYFI